MASASEPRESPGMVLAFVLNYPSTAFTPVDLVGPEPSAGRAVGTTDAGREAS